MSHSLVRLKPHALVQELRDAQEELASLLIQRDLIDARIDAVTAFERSLQKRIRRHTNATTA